MCYYVLAAASFSNVSGIPFVAVVLAVVGVPAVAYVSCCLRPYIPFLSVLETLLLLVYPDVPVLSPAAVVPAVSVVLSDIDVEPQLWLDALPLPPSPSAIDVVF